uniref:Uncharacterized protein n=1 Tax=Bos indicus x Bos taurus TaxID=30522 RepID=A0A4W2BWZ7_BOBOX
MLLSQPCLLRGESLEETQASLSLGRWSLWLLLLGLALPSASAQALSYREAVLRAVDRINDGSTEAHLYRLLELDPPPKDLPGTRKAVSFRVKETVCPRPSLQPPEQCDFKENGLTLGLVKQCLGTVSLDRSDDQFDINCNEASGPFCVGTLAWKIPWTEEPGRLQSMGLLRVGYN